MSRSAAARLLDELQSIADPAERVARCERELAALRRDDDPFDWALLHGVFAGSLAQANAGSPSAQVIERVLASYRSALEVFSPDESAELWAATLRNIGRTHADAAAAGLGDGPSHDEAAITAYSKAATIAPHAAPEEWIGAHRDLAAALRTAAAWRGPRALAESAEVLGRLVHALPAGVPAETSGALHAQYAEAIAAAGDLGRAAEGAWACEQALQVFTRESEPLAWAQLQLMLGGLLRARSDGERAEHLERAADALEAALSVFDAERFPDQWLQAHYELGPVLVFRSGGDRNDNLRRAVESLRIAAAANPRAQAPQAWAALQVTQAQAWLDQSGEGAQARIEQALPLLEAALAALPAEEPSPTRLLAQRFLGEACLRRAAGDENANLERGIAALAAAQALDRPPRDPQAWATAQSNLGQAWVRRRRGEAADNRARAVAAFEGVLAMPLADGAPPQGWAAALA